VARVLLRVPFLSVAGRPVDHLGSSGMGQLLSSLYGLFDSLVRRPYWRSGVLAPIGCICIILIGTEVWQLWRLHDANIQVAGVVTATSARSTAEQVYSTIKTADSIVASIVERVEAEGTGPEARTRFYRLMTSLAAALPAIHEMGITDSDGNAIVKSLVPDPTGMNYSEREYFRFHATHPDRGPFIGARIKSKVDGSYNITVTRRINRPNGSFAGVVVTSVSMKFFQQLFDQMQATSGGIIALLDDDDTVLARSPAASTATAAGTTTGSELRQLMLKQPPAGSVGFKSSIDGVGRYGSYQHLNQFPLVTLVAQSNWDVQSSFRAQLGWNAIILCCAMIVVVVMGSGAIKANRLLNSQAMQDGLTGLANRRVFDQTIRLEFQRAAWSRTPISIILIDIDHFKNYNDSYGHLAGDECLRVIAHSIQGCIRRSGDLVARYGGEEIAVVLPGLDTSRALALAETMRKALHDLALPHGGNAFGIVTFSAGLATCVGRNADSWLTLVDKADAALYAAKAGGRNTVQVWSPPVATISTIAGVTDRGMSVA
jgi:diguanylate cyclase (GGDEF)-like protein